MKKIFLALIIISSFSFACPSSYEIGGLTYYLESVGGTSTGNFMPGGVARFDTIVSIDYAPQPSYFNHSFIWDQNAYGHYFSQTICFYTATPPTPNNNPICYLGTHNDPANPQNCIDDFPIIKTDYLESGGVLIHYDDNKIMLLRRDGTGESWDLTTGEYFFPNRAFDGVVPPSASYNPFSFDKSQAIEYKELTFGDVAGISFNQAGVAIKDAANWLQAPSLLWTFALKTQKDTPTDTISKSGVSVTVSDHSSNNIDLSTYENSASSQPQPIPNTDMTAQKITSDSINQDWKNLLSLGDVLTTSASNPNKALIDTPTDIKFVQKNPDGSVDQTILKKADLINTATNNTDLSITQKQTEPEKTSNDGKISQKEVTTEKFLDPTNQNIELSKRTGLPLIVDYNPSTGLKDGKTYNTDTGQPVGTGTSTGLPSTGTITPGAVAIAQGGSASVDMSGVTGRLDKISNQLTKVNDALSAKDTPEAIPAVDNPIDNSKTDGLIDTFKTAWGTAKGNVDTLTSAISNAKDTVSGGFSLNLASGGIETCPYTATLDFDNGHTYELPIDFCKIFSPLKPILSIFFNILFQLMILTFSFKSFVRLV